MKITETFLILAFFSAASAVVPQVVTAQDIFDNESIIYSVPDAELIAEYFDFAPISLFDSEAAIVADDNDWDSMLLAAAPGIENEDYDNEKSGVDGESSDYSFDGGKFIPIGENFGPDADSPMEGPGMMHSAFFGDRPMMNIGRMGQRGMGRGGMEGMGMMRGGMGRMHDRMAIGTGMDFLEGMKDELGLSEDQIKQLRATRIDLIKATFKTRADLQVARLELRDLIEDKESDISAVEKKMRQVDNLSTDLKIASMKTLRNARKVLTDEQRAKLDEIKKVRPVRGMMMNRMDGRGGEEGIQGMPGGKHDM